MEAAFPSSIHPSSWLTQFNSPASPTTSWRRFPNTVNGGGFAGTSGHNERALAKDRGPHLSCGACDGSVSRPMGIPSRCMEMRSVMT